MIKRNLMRLEWKLGRRGWIVAAVVVLSFQAMFAGLAEIYISNDELSRLIESYPPAMLAAVGIEPDALTTFEGWMSTQPYTFFTLMLGVFAAIWASASIAKERDRQTAEWLFSLPYGRGEIFFSKALTHWLEVTAVYALSVAVTLGFGYGTTDVNAPGAVVLLLTAGYCIALAFAGIGYALTAAFRSERAAISAASGIVVVSFLLQMLNGLDDSVSWLSNFSLFQAFDAASIRRDAVLTPSGLATTLGIYFAGLAAGWAMLRRQDV
ncbi:ABC transporter permease subunit [Paenibacillus sp.]|uniref:ABC transporter permease subunit n=1 Tax=Paenibacillus sp. TaxID=58172 RepID=UPI00281232ED|nr:ABC transporter permease subunit [Paenibacillus sp.]